MACQMTASAMNFICMMCKTVSIAKYLNKVILTNHYLKHMTVESAKPLAWPTSNTFLLDVFDFINP